MAALPTITNLIYKRPPFATAQWPIASGVEIGEDDIFVGLSTGGVAGPLTDANGTYPSYAGVVQPCGRYPLPATGDASALTFVVVTNEEIELENVDVTGVTGVTDHEQPVYASDSKTLTLTASTNTLVGYVKRFRATGKADVRLYSHSELLAPRS